MTDKAKKREQLRAWRARNADRVREHNRRQAAKHAARIREYKRQWRLARREELREAAKRRYLENPLPAKQRARLWNRAHPGAVNALTAKRRAALNQRTPRWLTQQHFEQIREIYEVAATRTEREGIRYHVDHVVPLQGEEVSGLHVPWNLRVIRATENSMKGNKWTT